MIITTTTIISTAVSKEQERGGRRKRKRRERGEGKEGGLLQRGWVGVGGRSVQATPSEVVGDDDVGHSVKHHLDVSCIRGAGHVTVDFLVWRAVLALELCLDVRCCVLVGVGSWTERDKKKNHFYMEELFTFVVVHRNQLSQPTQTDNRRCT